MTKGIEIKSAFIEKAVEYDTQPTKTVHEEAFFANCRNEIRYLAVTVAFIVGTTPPGTQPSPTDLQNLTDAIDALDRKAASLSAPSLPPSNREN